MNYKTVFSEDILDGLGHLKFYGDDCYQLHKYDKKLPFNETRQQCFLDFRCYDHETIREKVAGYIFNKAQFKKENSELHKLLYSKGSIQLYKLLKILDIAKFKKVPYVFKINIYKARFFENDCDLRMLFCESDDGYYLFEYCRN